MARLSAIARLRRQRRQEWFGWLNMVVRVVIFLLLAFWMFMVKRRRDKRITGRSFKKLCGKFETYGKDRVEGSNTRDSPEMQVDGIMEEQAEDLADEFDDVSSYMPHGQSEDMSSSRKRKRKARMDPVVEGFYNAVKFFGERLEKIANTIGRGVEREEELDKKGSMITYEISKMQSLTQSEKFKAMTKIRDDFQKVNMFWDLEEVDREAFIKWVLKE